MTNLYASEFPWCLEPLLLRSLTLRGSRPNLLVSCALGDVDYVAKELAKWCASPVRTSTLPGWLDLPGRDFSGTLLLTRIEEMSLDQQVALFDWMTAAHDRVQVVSVATTRVDALAMDGRFLEGLFYRLNVVQLEARKPGPMGYRPAAPLSLQCYASGY